MTRLAEPADRVCDVLVAGAGLAGLTAAIAFARPDSTSSRAAPTSGSPADERSRCSTARSPISSSLGLWAGDRAAGRADAGACG